MNQLVQLFKKSLFLLVFCVFSSSLGQVGNLNNDIGVFASADLSYECVGGGQYKIILKVYTECGYVDGLLSNKDNFPVTVESKSLGIKFEPKVLKSTSSPEREGDEINIFCPDQPSQCDTRDKNQNRGLWRYTFSTIVNLDQLGKANDWKIYWARNNRSAEISTINPKQPYHTEASINNLTVCNSTPKIDVVSVFGIKKGEADTIKLAAADPNGNQLKYTIVSPLQALNSPITYKSGVSATQPFGEGKTITVTDNGEVLIPAISAANVNADFDVLIEEFNGTTKVGESRKGFQITTLETANKAPIISGINGTSQTTITICAGQQLNLLLTGTDPDGDKMRFLSAVQISPTKNIPFLRNTFDSNPTFKYTKTPTGTFSWKTTNADTGTYKVVVTLEDDACPVNLTTTKEFIINVNPFPIFSLGPDGPFNCGNPQVLNPIVANPVGNLNYEWSYWGINPLNGDTLSSAIVSTDQLFEVKNPSQLTLKVSDNAGCSRTDRINLWESLVGEMKYTKRCNGQTTLIQDESTFKGSKFVSRAWKIETIAGTKTDVAFEYKFPGLGEYDARLIVKDDLGCIDTVTDVIIIVDRPQSRISLIDSCSAFLELEVPDDQEAHNGVDFQDNTAYYKGDGLGEIKIIISRLGGISLDTINLPHVDKESPDFVYPDYGFPDSGMYVIASYLNTAASCIDTVFDTVHIVQRPKLALISDSIYSINCTSPDTVFQVTLDSHFIGTSGYDFWYFDQDSVKSSIQSFTDPKAILEIPIDTLGTYTFWVKDAKGCIHYKSVEVIFSTEAAFGYDLQCAEGAIQFRDSSLIDTDDRTIVDWNWDFGDGKTSKLQNPTHTYGQQKDYQAILNITDSKGCSSIDTLEVYYSFPVSNLKVLTDLDTIQLCAQNILKLENDLSLQPTIAYHLDSLEWRFIYANGDIALTSYPSIDLSQPRKWIVENHTLLDTTSSLRMEYEVRYNANPNNKVAAGQSCIINETLTKPLKIFPKFEGEFFDNRVCLGDSGIFKFIREVDTDSIKLRSASWVFSSVKTGEVIATTNEIDPSVFIDKEKLTRGAKQLKFIATFVDENRCVLRDSGTFDIDEVTAKPLWDFDTVACRGEKILFTLKADQGDVDYWQVNENYEDSLAAGNFVAPKFDKDVIGSPVIVFDKAGVTPISLFLIKNTSVQLGKICRSRIDDVIRVNDVPAYDIQWDSVCSGVSQTTFLNKSTINGDFGKVIDYRWDFGDGTAQVITPVGQVEVKHRYELGGNYTVKVTATTEEQCNRSDTTFQVYVRPTPKIDFVADQVLEANVPILFTDNSETYGAEKVYSTWDFGDRGQFEDTIDGSGYLELSHTVMWDSVAVYYISHSITTKDGCTGTNDSLRVDLDTYLDLPNAFSPNGEGTNDQLFLIYKSIRELYDFKIYNRWGQLIFDAEGDLDRAWDGTYNGTDQEVGVYVAYVKALGAYDKQFNFKVNVRLIR